MNYRLSFLNQNAKTCVIHVQIVNVYFVDLAQVVMARNVIVVKKVMSQSKVNVFNHVLLVTRLTQILMESLNALAARQNLVLSVVIMITAVYVKQGVIEKEENVANVLMDGTLNKGMKNVQNVEEDVEIAIELTALSVTNIISS